jgi:chaperone required for assembly of F1-ATPase
MKRFYKQAGVVPVAAGHGVTLDGRLVKTPGKRDLVVPNLALAATWLTIPAFSRLATQAPRISRARSARPI